jgi:UDP-glucose 4-epimerase
MLPEICDEPASADLASEYSSADGVVGLARTAELLRRNGLLPEQLAEAGRREPIVGGQPVGDADADAAAGAAAAAAAAAAGAGAGAGAVTSGAGRSGVPEQLGGLDGDLGQGAGLELLR